MTAPGNILVAVITSDAVNLPIMQHTLDTLTQFAVVHESRTLSPLQDHGELEQYITDAHGRGCQIFIAASAGGVNLAAFISARTTRPVLAVPLESPSLRGMDSLLANVQLPPGTPVGTLAIGKAGAINAALLATSILGTTQPALREKLRAFRAQQQDRVLRDTLE